MGTIAYGEAVLLGFDGARLLAFDAVAGAATWELTLPRAAVGVTLGSPDALAHGAAWRSSFSGSAAFAIDEGGHVHIVDATAGTLLASIDAEITRPTAIVAALDVLAIAHAKGVVVWRGGARFEIAERATALVFTDDGKLLAIGTQRGDVVVFDVAKRAPVYGHALDVAVTTMAWSASSAFLVGTRRGLFRVDQTLVRELRGDTIRALAVDPSGQNIAVSTKRGAVTTTRSATKIIGRGVRELAFGPNGLLAIGVTGGGVAIVDESQRLATRVEHRSGTWDAIVSAPGERPDPRVSPWVGVVIASLVAIGFVVVAFGGMVRTRDDTSSFPSSPASILRDMKCDHACEASRLGELRRTCSEQPAVGCEADAEAAIAAFDAAHCAELRASLSQIQTKVMARGAEAPTLIKAYLSLAQVGLDRTCIEIVEQMDPEPHVVRLGGPNLVPHLQPSTLGPVAAIHATDEGEVYAVARDRNARTCRVWSTPDDDSGKWDSAKVVTSCDIAKVFGHSQTSLLFLFGHVVEQLSGTTWTNIGYPGPTADSITQLANGDIYVTSDEQLWRRHDGHWAREEIPRVRGWMQDVATCGDDLCVQVLPHKGEDTQLWRRSGDGQWSIVRPETAPPGATHVWMRTSNDGYAGGDNGLLRFDGYQWSSAHFDEAIQDVTGTQRAVYVISMARK